MQVHDKPVVRVNGVALTDRDLLREMLSIFPYARQHNNTFPKSDAPKIRDGAMKMLVFEELIYQEAERRKMTVAPAELQQAEGAFRGQFPNPEEFNDFLKSEMKGSEKLLRERICRSLLIDRMLKLEVGARDTVSLAEVKAYYDKNPKEFMRKETFAIQTISILPPDTASDADKKKARERAVEALRQAKATKSYQEFGLLAEKFSEDDFHVNMGDHHAVERDQLPPEVIKAALAMKPGQVSDLIQMGSYFTFFRLNAHVPAGKISFDEAKGKLREDLKKDKYEKLRSSLDEQLRKKAKIEQM